MRKENGNFEQNKYLITEDGRKIDSKSIKKIAFIGGSWTSGRPLKINLPEVTSPKLVQGEPLEEWIKKSKRGNSEIIYCTWMGAGNKVNFTFIEKQIKAFNELNIHPTAFIIDAGWATKAGDWSSVDKQKFPHGLQEATKLIKENGMKPLLWLAPLHVEKDSDLAKKHPDWFIEKNGKPLSFWYKNTAFMPSHYLLDIRKIEVLKHLAKTAEEIKNCGFEGVKLDFLSSFYLVKDVSQKEKQRLTHKLMEIFKEKDLITVASGSPFNAVVGDVTDIVRLSSDSGLPNLPDNVVGKGANNYFVRHQLKGVIDNRRLVSKFINIDPDMYYSTSISGKDKQRLKKAQILSLYRAGCLTLGDDFSKLSPKDVMIIKELIDKFYRAQRLYLITKTMVRKNFLVK